VIPVALSLALAAALQIGASRTVLTVVVDSRDRAVVDVEADDFVIREAGQPRDVLSARVADYPVVVLIDNGPQASADLDVIKRAALRFITRIGQRPVALGTLGDTPAIVASFEDERAVVLGRLNGIRTATGSQADLVRGMAAAAQAVRAVDVPFSAIVVIAAGVGTPVEGAPTAWLQEILASHAIVSGIVNRAHEPTASIEQFRALAEQTHGQFAAIYSTLSYEIALDHLADQMAGEMMIDYIVPAGAPPKEDVTVGIRLPGLRVKGLGVR
jgi:hypothetical protein